MSDNDSSKDGCSCGCGGCIWSIAVPTFIVFLVLKLTETVDWPWLWVCSPLWIALVASVVLGFFAMVFGLGIIAVVLGTVAAAVGLEGLSNRISRRRTDDEQG